MTTSPDPTIVGDVAAALDAARPNTEILDTIDMAAAQLVAWRTDVHLEVHDLERYFPFPARSRGTRIAVTAAGFVATLRAVHNDGDPLGAAIYADPDACRLVAILDDDDIEGPGWRQHRVDYTPQSTPEWRLWVEGQGLQPQDKFAATIEAGESEIHTPSATVMLELAETFHASTSAKFKQAGRRRDGRTQLVYEEEVEAAAGEGMVDIPDRFTIEVRPFYGANPVLVDCRLRYRLVRGELTIGYTIHRPDEVRRQSFLTDVIGHVTAELPAWPLLEAKAPAPVTDPR